MDSVHAPKANKGRVGHHLSARSMSYLPKRPNSDQSTLMAFNVFARGNEIKFNMVITKPKGNRLFLWTLATHPNGRIERARPLFSQHPLISHGRPARRLAVRLLARVHCSRFGVIDCCCCHFLTIRRPPRFSVYLSHHSTPSGLFLPLTPPGGEMRKTMRQSGGVVVVVRE